MKAILLLERRWGLTIHGGEANLQTPMPTNEEMEVYMPGAAARSN